MNGDGAVAAHACQRIEGEVAKSRRLYRGGVIDNSNNYGKHQVCGMFY